MENNKQLTSLDVKIYKDGTEVIPEGVPNNHLTFKLNRGDVYEIGLVNKD